MPDARRRTIVAEPGSDSRPSPSAGQGSVPARRRALLALASDERLAKCARADDQAAFEAIFRRYEQDLYRFCMGILGEPQDAQDALQNTMVKVLRALPGERREIKLKPWLYRIAHNEAVELRRRQRPVETLEPEIVAAGISLEDRAEDDERLRSLLADMSELPQRQRAALVMRELNGLEFDEIAAALRTSPGAVRQALYEARRGLQEMKLGHEMRCEEAALALSDRDGSTRGRRDVRTHLRDCPECRRFQAEIADRKQTLAAISPLPAFVAAGIVKGVLGGSGGVGAGLGAGSVAGGALGGGAVATSIGASGTAKSVVAIIAAVAIGTAAVGRSDLVHLGPAQPQPAGGRAAEPGDAGVAAGPAGRPRIGARQRPSAPESARHLRGNGAATGVRVASGSAMQAGATVDAGTATGGPGATVAPPTVGPTPKTKAPGGVGWRNPEGGTGAGAEKQAKEHPEHPAHPQKQGGSEGEKATGKHSERSKQPGRGPAAEAAPAPEASPHGETVPSSAAATEAREHPEHPQQAKGTAEGDAPQPEASAE